MVELHEGDWVIVEERCAFCLKLEASVVGVVDGAVDLNKPV